MANPNLGQIVANAWENIVTDNPVDNIFEDYWMFEQFSKGDGFKGVEGGRTVNGTIQYALNTTVSSYTDSDTISTTRIDVFDEFSFNWKEYAGNVVLSYLEQAKNQGSSAKFDLLEGKLDNLKSTMQKQLNDGMLSDGTGNNSKDIGGLQLLVSSAPTTGTVGGINRGTFSFWRNQQTSGAKTTTAFDNLRATCRSIYNLCGSGVDNTHPSFALTDRATFEGYEGLLVANERYTSKDRGDGGFKNEVLTFKDIMIAYDKSTAFQAGSCYFLNTKFLKLAYQKGFWMKGRPSIEPANQTIQVFTVMTICNLFTTNPRRLGVVTGIN
jgi:hypothetical protein